MKKIIFGKINDSFFVVHFYTDEKPQCPDGFVVMKSERPIDGDYIASADGEWVIDNSNIIESNKEKQQQLLNEANAEIDILNRAVRLRRASNADKKRLELLENYTIDLYELDVNDINIVFPVKPE